VGPALGRLGRPDRDLRHGLEGIDSDYAPLLRTVVIVLTLGALIDATGKWQSPWDLPSKSVAFLVLSALATGASRLSYVRALSPASQVAPVDDLSVVLVALFAVVLLGERPEGGSGPASPWSRPWGLLLSLRH
jgi:bacterial/archaeal transporter family protein